jgi:hypothetical protein
MHGRSRRKKVSMPFGLLHFQTKTELKVTGNNGETIGNEETKLTLRLMEKKSSWRVAEMEFSVGKEMVVGFGERESENGRGRWEDGWSLWGYLYPLPILVKFCHFDPTFRLQITFKNLLSPELDITFNLLTINKFTRIKILVFTINALSGPIPGRKLFFSRESPGLLFGTWQLSPP